jgi:hypothetical protein
LVTYTVQGFLSVLEAPGELGPVVRLTGCLEQLPQVQDSRPQVP